VTPYELAQRYVGIREISGEKSHPLVQWWHSLCGEGLETPDEVAWCSAFVNGIAWELRLPRSKSPAARSWLGVGVPVPLEQAFPGSDVVIIKRGPEPQPGPEVTAAQGHVGWFAGREGDSILILGGNQGDQVSVAPFAANRLLGIRRLGP